MILHTELTPVELERILYPHGYKVEFIKANEYRMITTRPGKASIEKWIEELRAKGYDKALRRVRGEEEL